MVRRLYRWQDVFLEVLHSRSELGRLHLSLAIRDAAAWEDTG